MAKVSVIFDRVGNTLDVWFTKPQKAISEEVGHGVILKKDKRGRILGFEKINFLARGQKINSKSDLKLKLRWLKSKAKFRAGR